MKKEVEDILLMSIESRAKQEPKELSCLILSIMFLTGPALGLYYWFVEDIIFSYDNVTPLWGFCSFSAIGIVLSIIINYIYAEHWSDYNNIIKDANNEIENIIKTGQGDAETLLRLKKELIERKIGKTDLTDEEFHWHSSRYCWGCGEMHIVPGLPYTVHRERTESWKEGAYRYSKTFHCSSDICLCPSCYSRLKNSDQISRNNDNVRSKIMIGLYIIVAICGFFTGLTPQITESEDILSGIGMGLLGAFFGFGLAASLGQIILIPLAAIIAIPFTKENKNTSIKWTFDAIPEIRRFMKKDLPHTH